MNMFENLKKEVEYKDKRYIITFETIETNDKDITYVIVNNKQVDVRTYEDNLSITQLKGMITKAIEEYLSITKAKRTTESTIEEFNMWDGKL